MVYGSTARELENLQKKCDLLTRRNEKILNNAFNCEEKRKKLESENKSLFRQLNEMSDKYMSRKMLSVFIKWFKQQYDKLSATEKKTTRN